MQRPDRLTVYEPEVRCVLAPNPSPMTFHGTNTYILGLGDVAIVDPGPLLDDHLDAILAALGADEQVVAILVTHAHRDHSPLAKPLSQRTGAPIYGYGDCTAGRSDVMQKLAAVGLTGGGEGVDRDFLPDHRLADGDVVTFGQERVTALWTPGHMANHLSFVMGDRVFTGDLIMGWASTMISPPDGDLSAFMASAARLAARKDRMFFPGHGDPIAQPQDRVRFLIDHRRAREQAVLRALECEGKTIAALTREIYKDVAPALIPAAERNVFAHLIDLSTRGQIGADPTLSLAARFFRKT